VVWVALTAADFVNSFVKLGQINRCVRLGALRGKETRLHHHAVLILGLGITGMLPTAGSRVGSLGRLVVFRSDSLVVRWHHSSLHCHAILVFQVRRLLLYDLRHSLVAPCRHSAMPLRIVVLSALCCLQLLNQLPTPSNLVDPHASVLSLPQLLLL
jgi:hypothetical protein